MACMSQRLSPCCAGSSPCDSRRPLHLTQEHFPGIDYSQIETDEDVQWQKVHEQINNKGEYRVGESEDATEQRGLKFLKWLLARYACRTLRRQHVVVAGKFLEE